MLQCYLSGAQVSDALLARSDNTVCAADPLVWTILEHSNEG